jgi:hypothetical protein
LILTNRRSFVLSANIGTDAVGRNMMNVVIAPDGLGPDIPAMNKPINDPDESEIEEESTYALLERCEEKKRNLLEMVIYPLLIAAAVIAIWQFTQQPVTWI